MTVSFEVYPPLARAFRSGGDGEPASWQVEVARGETLGRVLARLAAERPELSAVYSAEQRNMVGEVRLAVNGRNYELIGGLTYLVRQHDRFSFTRA